MKENTVEAIKAGLKDHDGCEFDIRLTSDNIPVLHHNPQRGKIRIRTTPFRELGNIHTLEMLVNDPDVVDLVNNKNRIMLVKIKEDGPHWWSTDSDYCHRVAKYTTRVLKKSPLDLKNVKIISFSPDVLMNFKGFTRYILYPYIFGMVEGKSAYYNPKTVFQLLTSLKTHARTARRMNFDGILFTNKYLIGGFSKFQPSRKEILKIRKKDFLIGANAKNKQQEDAVHDMLVITDYQGKRKKRKYPLICHRGVVEE